MRIIHSFYKKNGLWYASCPSDNSGKESIFVTVNDAINYIFKLYKDVGQFEIVIPLPIPKPIRIKNPYHERKSKYIRKMNIPKVNKIMKALYKSTHLPDS
jgi:hypothetical protein